MITALLISAVNMQQSLAAMHPLHSACSPCCVAERQIMTAVTRASLTLSISFLLSDLLLFPLTSICSRSPSCRQCVCLLGPRRACLACPLPTFTIPYLSTYMHLFTECHSLYSLEDAPAKILVSRAWLAAAACHVNSLNHACTCAAPGRPVAASPSSSPSSSSRIWRRPAPQTRFTERHGAAAGGSERPCSTDGTPLRPPAAFKGLLWPTQMQLAVEAAGEAAGALAVPPPPLQAQQQPCW